MILKGFLVKSLRWLGLSPYYTPANPPRRSRGSTKLPRSAALALFAGITGTFWGIFCPVSTPPQMSCCPPRVLSQLQQWVPLAPGHRAPSQRRVAAWHRCSSHRCRNPWKSGVPAPFYRPPALTPAVLQDTRAELGSTRNSTAWGLPTGVSESFPGKTPTPPRAEPQDKARLTARDAALGRVSGQLSPPGGFLSVAQSSPWRDLSTGTSRVNFTLQQQRCLVWERGKTNPSHWPSIPSC